MNIILEKLEMLLVSGLVFYCLEAIIKQNPSGDCAFFDTNT